jgi:hypothetical protein
MTMIVRFGIAIGLALGVAACGGGDKGKMNKIKDDMCACKDRACVDKVEKDNEAFVKSLGEKYKDEKDVPKDLLAIGEEIDKCEHAAKEAEDKAKEGDDGAKMTAMKDAMCACKDAACIEKVQKDNGAFMKAMGDKYKGDQKPTEAMMKIGEEMGACMAKAMSADAPAPAPAPAADGTAPAAGGGGDTGIAECDDYMKSIDKLMACDKMPAASKDAMKQGLDAMKSSWAQLKDAPAEAKKAAGDGCKQAVDAIKQSASAMGCAL